MKAQEQVYYQKIFFDPQQMKESSFIISDIKKRKPDLLMERFDHYLADIFFFTFQGERYFGRKTLSILHLEKKQKSKKCPQITAPMIVGLVLRDQITEMGAHVFHKKLTDGEKLYIFNRIKTNPLLDLYFPYPYLVQGIEKIQSDAYWKPTDAVVNNLNAGEEIIRQYTIEFLKQFDLQGKKIFDPACSTGKFLGTLKECYPQIRAIGQDLNPDMVEYAQTHHTTIDELHIGDSLKTAIPEESVDFVIFRFLNVAIVTNEQATSLFHKLANCCVNGGYLIVFGHSPVLLSTAWFEMLGLMIEQTIAYNATYDSIYQYYVLKKIAPIPALTYTDFFSLGAPKPVTLTNDVIDLILPRKIGHLAKRPF